MTQSTSQQRTEWLPRLVVLASWSVLAVLFFVTYWNSILQLVNVWRYQWEYYGHGFLVPLFSLLLLWLRRDLMDFRTARGSWWGIPFLAVWALMRWTSAYFMFQTLDAPSMIPLFAGLTILVGGWRAFHWAWPSIVFLAFMMPLPGFLATRLSLPLQQVGATISTYTIQTIGIPAVVQGNIIRLQDGSLDVAQACSGLRMLMLFFAICVGAAFTLDCQFPSDDEDGGSRGPWLFAFGPLRLIWQLMHARIVPEYDTLWKKIVIVASAVPIAVIANVVRLALTAIFYHVVNPEFGAGAGHDLAGVLMMPLALLILWGEVAFLSVLLLDPIKKSYLSVSLAVKMREGNS